MQTEEVRLEWASAGVATITIDRPGRLNSVTVDVSRKLAQTVADVGDDPGCRAIVITGAGRAFCAGADIDGVRGRADGSQPSARGRDGSPAPTHMLDAFLGVVRNIRSVRAPVIAAVNGPAVGAGMALAVAADLRVMSRSAELHVGTIKIGLSGGEAGLSWLLPRCIGVSRAMELLLTGRPIGAEEAAAIGLTSAVVDDGEALGGALALAERIKANSPSAVWMTKRVVWANQEASFASALELEARTQTVASTSADFREAVTAFRDKRPAIFGPLRET